MFVLLQVGHRRLGTLLRHLQATQVELQLGQALHVADDLGQLLELFRLQVGLGQVETQGPDGVLDHHLPEQFGELFPAQALVTGHSQAQVLQVLLAGHQSLQLL